MRKRSLCLALAVILTCSQGMSVSASSKKQQLIDEKAAAESQLEVQEKKIANLEEQKTVLSGEIEELDQDLVDLLVEIEILGAEVTDKEEEIVQTQADLEAAKLERDDQYEDMKTRIQYLYENGGGDAWTQLILAADGFASMLNHAEYVQKLYDSDRKALESFKAVVQQVADLQESLEVEKADLVELQREYENQQANLEIQIEEKKATSDDYESQIETARQQAVEYTSLIRRQNAEIRRIEEEEKKAAEEKARKEAEERARKAEEERKAAEERARQEEQKKNNNNNGNSSNGSSSGNKETPAAPSQGSGNQNSSTPSNQTPASTPQPTQAPAPQPTPQPTQEPVPYNPTGQAVIDYALQFVGNPYVYGGTSLTNGTDCSGFTQSIYSHFGVSIPRSSASQRSAGRGVSYAEAMPGDIICYSGHVALYIGGGAIVHASNERDGIKISPDATYRPILTVRRVL